MSDMGMEAPDADSAEQERDAIPELNDSDEVEDTGEMELEVDRADRSEQARALRLDDDEYR